TCGTMQTAETAEAAVLSASGVAAPDGVSLQKRGDKVSGIGHSCLPMITLSPSHELISVNPALFPLPDIAQARGLTIRISEESAALLARQAAAHGLSVQAWVEKLAQQKQTAKEVQPGQQETRAAIACILEIQKRVKPDPEGWSIRDFINYGRR
ncbi:MAG: hypothetical protein M3Y27_27110, partial [Acidobacteriota bacterium]|nr:hypothetical protein [Acidobacteriota bacterium]